MTSRFGTAGAPAPSPAALLVDAANVLGAGARGWWRDRPAAMARLADRLSDYAEAEGLRLVLVLDAPDLPAGRRGSIVVDHATRRGRDAADDRIRELLAEHGASTTTVVTSDRALRDDVTALGARVIGAGAFLARLDR